MTRKILIAWELGGGLGHALRMAPLAQRFMDEGCEVTLVVRDLSHPQLTAKKLNCRVLQAPLSQVPAPRFKHETYADLLIESGYVNSQNLFSLVTAWKSLFDLIQPDLVLMDFAPTALLAARICGIKSAWYGSGFFYPPMTTPLPSFRHWEKDQKNDQNQRELDVLRSVNSVLAREERPELPRLVDMFKVDRNFLCTWPELDCYDRPPDTLYWGECFAPAVGAETSSDVEREYQVFCYLKAGQIEAEGVLDALRSLQISALVFIRNIPEKWVQKYESKHLRFAKEAIHMDSLIPRARFVICSAGVGTIASALLAGKPMLLIPIYTEQFGNAVKIEKLGAGINAKGTIRSDLRQLIKRLIDDPSYAEKAEAFARKYTGFSTSSQMENMVDSCLSLLTAIPSHTSIDCPTPLQSQATS
ncbi:glycosyltransferase [Undibacterium sp. TJN25]|uniref:glycosyltransferase n=1 Tax=Undibacterium sp. TJN25 TaxID=3413056 RepID=UPI003BF1E524